MRSTPHSQAILSAFLVTFLWSTSWILIKLALEEIPPLIFAGLRYGLAFLILLPGLWRHKSQVQGLSRQTWGRLAVLGLVFYTFTQGGLFISLKYLESVTFSLMLNFTTLLVALGGILTLREFPNNWQWGGMLVFLGGVLVYFYPLSLPQGGWLGLSLGSLTVCANAVASILGRSANRDQSLPPLVVTTLSMGIGAAVLLVIGYSFFEAPAISLRGWVIIAWLGLVNTAFAFTLWNKTLQVLSAVESSMINNTMLIQIAVLAWLFLGEVITASEILGLAMATAGILVFQAIPKKRMPQP